MSRVRAHDCLHCGAPAVRKYCSSRCSALATNTRIRAAGDQRVRRRERVANAPGLTEYGIRQLVRRWIRQGKQCTYCAAPATTADHVLPLVRGGTNYEGNLTPSCKSCNSRKAGYTIIEWRTGKRLPPMTDTLDTMGRRKPQRKPRAPKLRPHCAECGAQCPPRRWVTCSDACAARRFRDYMRNRYRDSHGIPRNAPRYTHRSTFEPAMFSGSSSHG